MRPLAANNPTFSRTWGFFTPNIRQSGGYRTGHYYRIVFSEFNAAVLCPAAKAAKNGRICHDFGESRNAPLRENPDRLKPLLGMGQAQTFYCFSLSL
jgi:hypothetical protein